MPNDQQKELLHCYNLGCGQKYDPDENKEDSCVHHPGAPFFHDAYKGWSCCKKKCTDFTEFLNIKGCQRSFHSNVKPPEPEKQVVDKSKANEVIEYKAPQPVVRQALQRPAYDTPMVELKPTTISSSLQPCSSKPKCVEPATSAAANAEDEHKVKIGMPCKNKGCKKTYEGDDSNYEDCLYHPGVPVFHEGLKFWSCCTKRTSDFNAFLEQQGCNIGKHKWFEDKKQGDSEGGGTGDNSGNQRLHYRYDWHQTVSHVVMAVYAKNYSPEGTSVKLSPVRLAISIQDTATSNRFDLDLPLHGVVDVANSSTSFLATKVEVKLRKAEPGSWIDLSLRRPPDKNQSKEKVNESADNDQMKCLMSDVDAVDLSSL